jgi:hypothetical protein
MLSARVQVVLSASGAQLNVKMSESVLLYVKEFRSRNNVPRELRQCFRSSRLLKRLLRRLK